MESQAVGLKLVGVICSVFRWVWLWLAAGIRPRHGLVRLRVCVCRSPWSSSSRNTAGRGFFCWSTDGIDKTLGVLTPQVSTPCQRENTVDLGRYCYPCLWFLYISWLLECICNVQLSLECLPLPIVFLLADVCVSNPAKKYGPHRSLITTAVS